MGTPKGKMTIITGAAKGIGRAIALRIAPDILINNAGYNSRKAHVWEVGPTRPSGKQTVRITCVPRAWQRQCNPAPHFTCIGLAA
jgi:NAD(P)-dependent dehydrogenase (short-subunit alcohol dehydrogenase family)